MIPRYFNTIEPLDVIFRDGIDVTLKARGKLFRPDPKVVSAFER